MSCKTISPVLLTIFLAHDKAENFPALENAERSKVILSAGTEVAPVIGGVLKDRCWSSTGKVTGFMRTKTTDESDEQTVVAVNHTSDALLVAAVIWDKKIVGKERKRDEGTWEDDCFELFLDPIRSRQDRFHFIISAAGMIYDARLRKGVWNSNPEIQIATRQWPGKGWTVEMAIPFKTLETKTPRRGDVWDIKLAREDYDNPGGVYRLSSWQPTGADFSDTNAYGRLVFEHRNRSWNGDLSKGLLESNWTACGWRKSKQSKSGSLALNQEAGRSGKDCGLREIRIWGKARKKISPPRAFAAALKVERGKGGPALAPRKFSIFPTPKVLTLGKGYLRLQDPIMLFISADAGVEVNGVVEDLAERLKLLTGISAQILTEAGDAAISLRIQKVENGDKAQGEEGYELKVNEKSAEIIAGG